MKSTYNEKEIRDLKQKIENYETELRKERNPVIKDLFEIELEKAKFQLNRVLPKSSINDNKNNKHKKTNKSIKKKIAAVIAAGAVAVGSGGAVYGITNIDQQKKDTAIVSILKNENSKLSDENRDVVIAVLSNDSESNKDLYENFDEIRDEYIKTVKLTMVSEFNNMIKEKNVKFEDLKIFSTNEEHIINLITDDGKEIVIHNDESKGWSNLDPLLSAYVDIYEMDKENYSQEELAKKFVKGVEKIETVFDKYNFKFNYENYEMIKGEKGSSIINEINKIKNPALKVEKEDNER